MVPKFLYPKIEKPNGNQSEYPNAHAYYIWIKSQHRIQVLASDDTRKK